MKRPLRFPRWALFLTVGLVLVFLVHRVFQHPYFWLCVDKETTVWKYERAENSDLLLRAVRSSVLPHSVRVECLRGLARLTDRTGLRIFLSNEEIDELAVTFQNDFNDDFFTLFLSPFVGDKINPRVAGLIEDPNQKRGVRLVAFLHLIETQDLAQAQVDQIEKLWRNMEPVQLQNLALKFVKNFSGQGGLDPALEMRFMHIDQPPESASATPLPEDE